MRQMSSTDSTSNQRPWSLSEIGLFTVFAKSSEACSGRAPPERRPEPSAVLTVSSFGLFRLRMAPAPSAFPELLAIFLQKTWSVRLRMPPQGQPPVVAQRRGAGADPKAHAPAEPRRAYLTGPGRALARVQGRALALGRMALAPDVFPEFSTTALNPLPGKSAALSRRDPGAPPAASSSP